MLSAALPPKCLHCGQPTEMIDAVLSRYLCSVCLRVLDAESTVAEERLRDQLIRTAPDIEFARLCSLHTYREASPIRAIIHAAKYEGMMKLGRALGERLADHLEPESYDVIVPVPLHRTRRAERGYNQAEQLAAGIDRRRTVANAVRRSRPTKTQTQLHVEERLQNVRGAFGLTRHAAQLTNRRVLILDDVMTTGATIASVAESLLLARPLSLSIATVAVADDAHDTPIDSDARPF